MAQEGLFEHPVSSMLARALADAAAGYPAPLDEGSIYLVASYTAVPDPTFNGFFDIQPPFPSADEAQQFIECMGLEGYGVFGPFQSTYYQQQQNQLVVDQIQFSAPGETITVVELDSPPADSPPGSLPLLFDAFFLSASAVAKFAVPYYAKVYSPAFANRVMDEFQQAEVALMGHYPWSEYTDFPDGPLAVDSPCRPAAHLPVVFIRDEGGNLQGRAVVPHPHERKG